MPRCLYHSISHFFFSVSKASLHHFRKCHHPVSSFSWSKQLATPCRKLCLHQPQSTNNVVSVVCQQMSQGVAPDLHLPQKVCLLVREVPFSLQFGRYFSFLLSQPDLCLFHQCLEILPSFEHSDSQSVEQSMNCLVHRTCGIPTLGWGHPPAPFSMLTPSLKAVKADTAENQSCDPHNMSHRYTLHRSQKVSLDWRCRQQSSIEMTLMVSTLYRLDSSSQLCINSNFLWPLLRVWHKRF